MHSWQNPKYYYYESMKSRVLINFQCNFIKKQQQHLYPFASMTYLNSGVAWTRFLLLSFQEKFDPFLFNPEAWILHGMIYKLPLNKNHHVFEI